MQVSLPFSIACEKKCSSIGLMVAGIGGNNGSTLASSILLHRSGDGESTTFGSVLEHGTGWTLQNKRVPLKEICTEMVSTQKDIHVCGWEVRDKISTLRHAIQQAGIIPPKKQELLENNHADTLSDPSIVIPGVWYEGYTVVDDAIRKDIINRKAGTKWDDVQRIMSDIDKFAKCNNLEKIIVVYSGSTEKTIDVVEGVNGTEKDLMQTVRTSLTSERDSTDCCTVSPSVVYALAAILCDTVECIFINAAAQNTCDIPGLRAMATSRRRLIIGNDLKTGQTSSKGCIAEYMIKRGIKLSSIWSNNALHNHDGFSISHRAPNQSKIHSKSSMTNNFVHAAPGLYRIVGGNSSESGGKDIAHDVSISYVPGTHPDRKRAIDEFIGELAFGKYYEMYVTTFCEDTTLAIGVLFDLILLAEMLSRVRVIRETIPEHVSIEQANMILSAFVKSPSQSRFMTSSFFSEQYEIVSSLLLLLKGIQPVHYGIVHVLS